jgi:hypothetical protein
MPNLSILMAPAETKQPGGNPFAPDMFDYRTSGTFNYFDELNPERRALIDALQDTLEACDEEELADFFGLEGPELDEAIRVNSEIYDAPLMSALDRYSPSIMYAAMDFANLPTGAQRRLLENGIIFSGLFGLLRPDDLIPNYRLRMDAELPEIGSVAEYWRERHSDLLNDNLEGRFVWDLLSDVQHAAWTDEKTYEARYHVRHEVVEDGERKPVEDEADIESLCGQFVNYIVEETAEDLEALEEWEDHPEGYRYDPDATTFDEETKTGTVVLVKEE